MPVSNDLDVNSEHPPFDAAEAALPDPFADVDLAEAMIVARSDASGETAVPPEWLGVQSGVMSVSDAIRSREGLDPLEQIAFDCELFRPMDPRRRERMLQALLSDGQAVETAPDGPQANPPTALSDRREYAAGAVVAMLALAACTLLVLKLMPASSDQFVASYAQVGIRIEAERRSVAPLSFAMESGDVGHLGTAGAGEVVVFTPGDTLLLRGMTTAAATPRPEDISIRLGSTRLRCEQTNSEVPRFSWNCTLPIQPTPTPALLRACAKDGMHDVACTPIGLLDLRPWGEQ